MSPPGAPGTPGGAAPPARPLSGQGAGPVLVTANAAWNVVHFRRPVLAALRARGHPLTVLAPAGAEAAAVAAIPARLIDLPMDAKGINPARDAALLLRMRRRMKEVAPDVVLSFTIKNNLYGALAARSLGIPFIPNVSGLGTAFLSTGALRRVTEALYRTAFRGLETVFFQNRDDLDLFLDRGLVRPAQAGLLPGSGIDLSRFAPAPPPSGPPRVLMIARLLRDKGVLEFVEAAGRVRATRPDVRFQLLGAAGSENRSAIDPATVRRWHEQGLVEHLGVTDDVRPAIAAATCVVLPSYREGAPRTLIEAAAMARPVIATDVPGCRAVVEDGRTGLLCEPRSGASLAEACERLLALPAGARAAMGAEGRRKMEAEFDEAFVVARYLEAIDRADRSGAGRDRRAREG